MKNTNRLLPTMLLCLPLHCLLLFWLPQPAAAQIPDFTEFGRMFDPFREMTAEERDALEAIDVAWEQELAHGRTAYEQYVRELRQQRTRITNRGRDVAYLEALVQRLQPFMENSARYRNLQVVVANSDEVDARSFPGGFLVFHRGLLERGGSEAAVAAVVGHELSHLDHGHQLKMLRQIQQMQTSANRPNGFSPTSMMRRMQGMMSGFHPFHPAEELVADRDGVTWAFQAGYDPRELARLFEQLRDARDGEPRPQDFMPSFFRTHPYHEDRSRAVLEQSDALLRDAPRHPLIVGRDNLTQRQVADIAPGRAPRP